jgi:hypothetical protein
VKHTPSGMAVLYIPGDIVTSLDDLELRCPNCIILKELPTLDNGPGQSAGAGRMGSMRTEGLDLMGRVVHRWLRWNPQR